MTDLWPRYAPLLGKVEKPSRYLGREYGAVEPAAKADADYHAVFIYPDTYEIGQANQAVAILYDDLNSDPHIFCERAYLPWIDMIEFMRAEQLPLCSLESFAPLYEFDFVGITLPHEMAATNVLEVLDLGHIPLRSDDRGEDDPLVFGGGPCAYNPEPYAPFFDAFFLGEGEILDKEVALLHRKMRDEGASRSQILEAIAHIPGMYVPSLYRPKTAEEIERPAAGVRDTIRTMVVPVFDDLPEVIHKNVIADFNDTNPLPQPIVPYQELVHDRLAVEILRGCARGCRFCQAGMIYRPVRERNVEPVVEAVSGGMTFAGYDEVSLTSLSSTDHSCIMGMVSRLHDQFDGKGIGISLPSQRVDSFGIELATLVAGDRKPSLTLAPEAGTQRLRDIINKGINEEQIFAAVRNAFSNGWRRCKLYFMIGLPGETDEDVAGIGDLCRRLYAAAKDSVPDDQRGNVRMSASASLFIPKPATPFQWDGQISLPQIEHRIQVLRDSMPRKGVDLHYHDSQTSYMEAVLARGGRECADLIEAAWKNGARFDAWSEQFDFDAWLAASKQTGVDIFEAATRTFAEGEALPWNHISCGVTERFLLSERHKAQQGITTPDCTFGPCSACGVCMDLGVKNLTEQKRSFSPAN